MSILWITVIVILVVIGVAIYLSNKKPPQNQPFDYQTGNMGADKPAVGYKHPCNFCGKLIPPNSVSCPFCSKVNPQGPMRCPKCSNPIQRDFKVCPSCNLKLETICPKCGQATFFGDYCDKCQQRMTVICPNCKTEQFFFENKCKSCGSILLQVMFCQKCKIAQPVIDKKCMVCGELLVKTPTNNQEIKK